MLNSRKVVLVSGANKGIGFEVARQLGKAGRTVLLGTRDKERGEKAAAALVADGLDVRPLHLDLEEHETARIAADLIRDQFGKLDLLVNNAAIARRGDGKPEKAQLSVVAEIMRTNFLGTVAVTQAMLPLLRNAEAAQIINVSSELGCVSEQTNPAWRFVEHKLLGYGASKAALNMLTVQLSYDLRDEGIAVNSVNPGHTKTDLNERRGTQTVEVGAAEIVRVALLEKPPTGKFLERGGEIPW